ncbi:hypothetical protein [Lapillicoccus sp.]|uniref:hypothetical protein n=1 Tax=Lapillicoccus sp. TaxID=1909287 RepID=UPI00387E5CA7
MADTDVQAAPVTVDDTVLEQLVEAAITDTSADEVTPSLTASSWPGRPGATRRH